MTAPGDTDTDTAALCLPDYGGACVASLFPSLLGAREQPWLPESVRSATSVVLLVADGLGACQLRRFEAELPAVASLEGGDITTVLPATTSSALTSITTGLPPAAHGLVGFRMRLEGSVLNVLRWQTEGGGRPPEPTTVQRLAAFGGRPVPAVTKADFRNSGFTRAHLAGAPFRGWRTTGELVDEVVALAQAREPLVYAYYPGIDETAHEAGLGDEYRGELAAFDAIVASLLERLPESCALLVTADHGQVDVAPDDWVGLGDLLGLVELQAGDARFRSLFARAGAARELAAACRERFSHLAWVKTRRELLDEGWLGPDAVAATAGRVGDVVLAPHAAVCFYDPSLPRERGLRTAHGAPTAAEMLVPLRAGRGQST